MPDIQIGQRRFDGQLAECEFANSCRCGATAFPADRTDPKNATYFDRSQWGAYRAVALKPATAKEEPSSFGIHTLSPPVPYLRALTAFQDAFLHLFVTETLNAKLVPSGSPKVQPVYNIPGGEIGSDPIFLPSMEAFRLAVEKVKRESPSATQIPDPSLPERIFVESEFFKSFVIEHITGLRPGHKAFSAVYGIPVHNEAQCMEVCEAAFRHEYRSHESDVLIVLVVNGSKDNSLYLAQQWLHRMGTPKNFDIRGLGDDGVNFGQYVEVGRSRYVIVNTQTPGKGNAMTIIDAIQHRENYRKAGSFDMNAFHAPDAWLRLSMKIHEHQTGEFGHTPILMGSQPYACAFDPYVDKVRTNEKKPRKILLEAQARSVRALYEVFFGLGPIEHSKRVQGLSMYWGDNAEEEKKRGYSLVEPIRYSRIEDEAMSWLVRSLGGHVEMLNGIYSYFWAVNSKRGLLRTLERMYRGAYELDTLFKDFPDALKLAYSECLRLKDWNDQEQYIIEQLSKEGRYNNYHMDWHYALGYARVTMAKSVKRAKESPGFDGTWEPLETKQI